MFVLDHVLVGPGHIGVGHITQGHGQRLDNHIIDRQLVGWFLVFDRRRLVQLRPQCQQRIQFAVHRNIEVWNGLFAFLQTLGDGLAHAVVLDQLVRPFFEIFQNGIRRCS